MKRLDGPKREAPTTLIGEMGNRMLQRVFHDGSIGLAFTRHPHGVGHPDADEDEEEDADADEDAGGGDHASQWSTPIVVAVENMLLPSTAPFRDGWPPACTPFAVPDRVPDWRRCTLWR